MTPRDPVLAREMLHVLDRLTDAQRRQVLDYVATLAPGFAESKPRAASGPLLGSLAHLGITISEEDIAEARKEMWGDALRSAATGPNGDE